LEPVSQKWQDLFALIPQGYDPIKTAEEGEWFDEDAAERGVRFFELFLTHTKGELAGQPFVLEPWQIAVTGCIYGWKRADGNRRYREAFIYVPRKNGKALAKDTPVLTENRGWITHGELVVGDRVFGECNSVHRVTHVFPDDEGTYYDITFDNGESLVAHRNHEWVVRPTQSDAKAICSTHHLLQFNWDYVSICGRDFEGREVRLASMELSDVTVGNCIEVSNPSGLYRVGITGVLTHNSSWCAGFALGGLLLDNEEGAEVYSLAGDKDQASLVFQQAKIMVERDPELSKRLKPFRYNIARPDTNSYYKYLSSEANTKHGGNTHLAIIDEVHAIADSELIDVIDTSTGSRSQPLIIYITTADYARESKCNELLDRALNVCNGNFRDSSFLPVVYKAELDDDWTDPKVWAKANPNLGVSVKTEYIEKKCQKARDMPSFENTFKRLHLNIQTEQDERWLQVHEYDQCPSELPSEDELKGSPCYGGIDLSSTTDLTGFALYWPEYHCVKLWLWIPEVRMSNKRDQMTYGAWVRDGYICTTPGSAVDYQWVRSTVVEASETYRVQDVGYDPWNATQFAIELNEQDGVPMVQFRQGFASMNEPCKELERLIVQHKFNHGGNPVLRWMVSNATKKEDPAGNVKPDKSKSAEKIDGLIASVIAIGRSMFNEETESVYETRGIITL